MRRHFLFLQGGVSPLFTRLGGQLERSGHRVSRLNFCAGDQLLWRRPGAIAFREPLARLRPRLAAICDERQISDLLLFGASRPVHRPAIALAAELGLRAYLVEEGYLRPNWLSVERAGVNGESGLPRDPDWYRRVARSLSDQPSRHLCRAPMPLSDLRARAVRGAAYQLARLVDPLWFPHYRSHRREHPLIEIRGWLRRFSRLPVQRAADAARIEQLLSRGAPLFLLPLQLRDDAQVVCHSGFKSMGALIDQVIASFARYAPDNSQLLIKNHPLDSGLCDLAGQTRRAAAAADVAARVHYVETGELTGPIDLAAGLVTINSTSGLTALLRQCPTIALGRAVYDLPGLTFQGPLDRFWRDCRRPDAGLIDAFRRVLIHSCQLPGNLYTEQGIQLALQGIEAFLTEPSPLEGLLARFPLPALASSHEPLLSWSGQRLAVASSALSDTSLGC